MNRVDFMSQLERLLQNIAASEREEAIQYYNDYFDDAGKENEQAVIEALGSPARVAENIKKDLLDAAGGEEAAGKVKASDRVLMEYGKGDRNREDGREAGDDRKAEDGRNTGDGQGARYGRESGPWGSYVQGSDSDGGDFQGGYSHRQPAYAQPVKDDRTPAWLIALAVTVLILLSPAILGVVLSVLGVLGGGLAAWFVMILGFGVAALGLFIAFVVLIVTGIICLYANPWVGVAMLGGGLICGCLGILFLMLTVAMAGIVTPAICRGIGNVFRFFFKKRAKA